jgi:predicted ABC-type ATPase
MSSGTLHQQYCDLKDRLFSGRRSVRPIFLLSFGPMGSGKTSRIEAHLRANNHDPGNFVFLVLDDIIEADVGYRAEVSEAIAQHAGSPREELSAALQVIYFKYRKDASVISEALLSIAVRSKFNVVFETTGSNASVGWSTYMFRRMSESGYETQLFYPFVRAEELCARCDERAATTGRWIPHETIKAFAQQAMDNFATLAPHSDHVWIVDNNGPNPQPVLEVIDTDDINSGTKEVSICARPEHIESLGFSQGLRAYVESICSKPK